MCWLDQFDETGSINPDEVVDFGTALQIAILTGDFSSRVRDVQLLDVMTKFKATASVSRTRDGLSRRTLTMKPWTGLRRER